MDTWCSDFCLTCDQQTYGTAYCSQTCRLADLEISMPAYDSPSPKSRSRRKEGVHVGYQSSSPSHQSSGTAFGTRQGKNEFSATSRGTVHARDTASQYFFGKIISESQSQSHPNGSMSPSSSDGSLSSMQSNSSSHARISSQAVNALKSYADSFDRSRDLKRKKSYI